MPTQHRPNRWVTRRPKKVQTQPEPARTLMDVVRRHGDSFAYYYTPRLPGMAMVQANLAELSAHDKNGKHQTHHDIENCRAYKNLRRAMIELRDYLNETDLS